MVEQYHPALWPAAGFVNTEIECFMKPEVANAATEVFAELKVEAVRLIKERGVPAAQAAHWLNPHEIIVLLTRQQDVYHSLGPDHSNHFPQAV